MKKSENKQVQSFLDDIMTLGDEKFEILQKLRDVVFDIHPEVSERIMYGGIMFSLGEKDFGGIFPSKKHVSFEFTDGYQFNDPKKFLEGTGKFRRHLKIKSLSDVKDKEVEFFFKQAG